MEKIWEEVQEMMGREKFKKCEGNQKGQVGVFSISTWPLFNWLILANSVLSEIYILSLQKSDFIKQPLLQPMGIIFLTF